MQALVFTAAGVVTMRDQPVPRPAPDEVLVQVRGSGICGSELHGFRSVGFRKPPLVMGHEFVGRTPDGVRVVVNPLLSCGECDRCRRDSPQLCRTRQLIGVNRDGGFAEFVAVPRRSVHPIPESIGWAAATLIEPLANAVHAFTLVPRIPEQIAIIGGGPIGLVSALVARHAGTDVTIVDTATSRRIVAEKIGFRTSDRLDDEAEHEVVVDAVGRAETRHASTSHLCPGGTAVWLGIAGEETGLAGNDLVRFEKRVVGSFAYRASEFEEAIALAQSLDLSWATEVPFAAAEETFYALAEGRSDIVKAVLVPDATMR